MRDPRPGQPLDIGDLALIETDEEATELERRLAMDLRYCLTLVWNSYRESYNHHTGCAR